MFRTLCMALAVTVLLAAAPVPRAQEAPAVDPFHRPYDQLLDVNVRDGLVYYRALQSERGRLDRYVASLDVPAAAYERWTPEARLAFWLNAYNALVLQTVVRHYPIRGKAPGYPAASIRQVPGAFEAARHRVAGRTLSLDDIEKTVLSEFKEPRAYLALGRGAIGSGRLRSEAYTASQLADQLAAVQREFVQHRTMLRIDRDDDQITVTPIVSWRAQEFVAAYDKGTNGPHGARSPVERALLTFITPHLLRLEREFVEKNQFRVAFHEFDWRLNDLSGGRAD